MKLFLDYIREPHHVFEYIKMPIYLESDWHIVRSHKEFIGFLKNTAIPKIISFDHDLADEHYTPSEYWDDYDKSKEYQEKQNYKEKTGHDCAKDLLRLSIMWGFKLPTIYVHSMNPVGADNIRSVFK